jgi:uncharacterized damage-inducible protein DinB
MEAEAGAHLLRCAPAFRSLGRPQITAAAAPGHRAPSLTSPDTGHPEWRWQGRITQRSGPNITLTKEDIDLLYEYDRWANGRVFDAALALNAEQFARDLGGSFRSVRDTLLHIVGSEWAWLTYWKEPSPSSAFLTDLWPRADALFHPSTSPDLAAVQRKWVAVEREQVEFVKGLTAESLRRTLPVGETHVSLAHLMQHLTNHSTYHRGQVALMMRQLAARPLATDFAMFLMEGRRAEGAFVSDL